jgi:metal-responsive CopG/Arc/MetJ family transcriptional regulator
MARVKVSVTVDPDLLNAVDSFVREHDELDRSKVIEQALTLWSAAQQETAMEQQFAGALESPAEKSAWRAVRRASAVKRLHKP